MIQDIDGKKVKISVVFPSYNESENIREALKRVSKSLGKSLLEIIIVDDNSPDGTWKIIQNLKNPKYRLIRRMNHRGLASALACGVEKTRGNVVVWMDCDLGIPPEDIPRLVNKLKNFDVSIGSRYVRGGKDLRPKWRADLSVLINFFANLLLGSSVKDFTSGFIAVRKKVLNDIKLSPDGFGEYFIEFVYRCLKKKYRIVEVGYTYRYRKGGISKSDGNLLVLLRLGIQYAWRVIKIKFVVK